MGNAFLKIGPPQEIDREYAQQKKLIQSGFPVAKIIESGFIGKLRYFVEKSLGNEHFGDVFAFECNNTGSISDSSFRKWIKVTILFARAQAYIVCPSANFNNFLKGLYYQVLLEELPHTKHLLRSTFRLVRNRLSKLPFSLTHGDLNAHNILPRGVIDFGSELSGPFGYDLATNLIHPYFFPRTGQYEIIAGYEFTSDQSQAYCKLLGQFCKKENLPNPILNLDEFIICRAVWAAARMAHVPRLQQWRFRLLEQLLSQYGKQELFPLLISATRTFVGNCTN